MARRPRSGKKWTHLVGTLARSFSHLGVVRVLVVSFSAFATFTAAGRRSLTALTAFATFTAGGRRSLSALTVLAGAHTAVVASLAALAAFSTLGGGIAFSFAFVTHQGIHRAHGR